VEITFEAFAADCVVRGTYELGAERLSDQLNAAETVELRVAVLQSLEDGHIVALPQVAIPVGDLCAVVAAGPRGAADRRRHGRADLVEIRVGPYTVIGDLHSMIGSGPRDVHRRNVAFVAVTEARVLGPAGEDTAVTWPATLLVNRSLIERVSDAGGAISAALSIPGRDGPLGPAR